MFVQVIKGRCKDAAGLRRQLDRWMDDIGPGASGWLGATAGVTKAGDAIVVVRFESEDAARRNSDRPEQGAWWNETSKYFDGEVTFRDCREVDTFMSGGSDDAGFVQVMQGRFKDAESMRAMEAGAEERLRELRPDLIGGVRAFHGDGSHTEANYFTSEAEARAGEKRMGAEAPDMASEYMSAIEDVRFFDLTDPLLYSPKR